MNKKHERVNETGQSLTCLPLVTSHARRKKKEGEKKKEKKDMTWNVSLAVFAASATTPAFKMAEKGDRREKKRKKRRT